MVTPVGRPAACRAGWRRAAVLRLKTAPLEADTSLASAVSLPRTGDGAEALQLTL